MKTLTHYSRTKNVAAKRALAAHVAAILDRDIRNGRFTGSDRRQAQAALTRFQTIANPNKYAAYSCAA